jgi:hypothetical protein
MNKYYTLVECPDCHLVYSISGRYDDNFTTYKRCICRKEFVPIDHVITEGKN